MKANEIIKMRRKDLGLTMKEVASAVGVSEATVSRWESGDIRNMREEAERKKLTKEFTNLCNVADIEHLLIAIDLIKRLEGMT